MKKKVAKREGNWVSYDDFICGLKVIDEKHPFVGNMRYMIDKYDYEKELEKRIKKRARRELYQN